MAWAYTDAIRTRALRWTVLSARLVRRSVPARDDRPTPTLGTTAVVDDLGSKLEIQGLLLDPGSTPLVDRRS